MFSDCWDKIICVKIIIFALFRLKKISGPYRCVGRWNKKNLPILMYYKTNVYIEENRRIRRITWEKIKGAWKSQFGLRKIIIFLEAYDALNSLWVKLYQKCENEVRTIYLLR